MTRILTYLRRVRHNIWIITALAHKRQHSPSS